MKKALLALILAPVLSVSATNAIANEAPEASAEMIKEYTEMCLNWAKDDDISNEDYKAIHIDKTKKAKVSYIAFGKDSDAYRNDYQVVRYKNMLKKQGFLIITVANNAIQY